MITAHKQILSGTPGQIRAKVEGLASDEDHVEYVAGTWFRELAVKLASHEGLAVSVVTYDGTTAYELEVSLANAPHHDPVVIDRSQPGDHCHISLERWLPISGEEGVEDAIAIVHGVLAASARPQPTGAGDTTAEP